MASIADVLAALLVAEDKGIENLIDKGVDVPSEPRPTTYQLFELISEIEGGSGSTIKSATMDSTGLITIVDVNDEVRTILPVYTNEKVTNIVYTSGGATRNIRITYNADGSLKTIGRVQVSGMGNYPYSTKAGLPLEIASSCPSPFLLNQNNLTSNVKYIFPKTTASVVPTSGTTTPYIKSGGTQWIDTGFIPDCNTKVLYKYQFTNTNNNTSLGGTDVNGDVSASLNLGCIYDNKIQYRLHYTSCIEQTIDTNIHEVVFNDNGYLIIDNNTLGSFSSRTSYVNSRNLTLFVVNSNSGLLNKSSAKLYYLKIYDNGVLVRDFVPAQSQESGHENEVCLYDNVTNAYFYNQGTGTFTYGEDVTPVTEIDVGDEVETVLSPANSYATFNYQWQKNDPSGEPPSECVISTADELICVLGGRSYYKYNNVEALCGYFYAEGHTFPLLISTISGDAVAFKTIGQTETNYNTFEYNDKTWYVCYGTYAKGGNHNDTSGFNRHKLTANTHVDAGKALIDYVEANMFTDISGATSSTYTAQSGDNAIRCILSGTGNSEGIITSSSTSINEVD